MDKNKSNEPPRSSAEEHPAVGRVPHGDSPKGRMKPCQPGGYRGVAGSNPAAGTTHFSSFYEVLETVLLPAIF